jgi:hypothetical protein
LGQSDIIERLIFQASSAGYDSGYGCFINRFNYSAVFEAAAIERPESIAELGA